MEKGIFLIEGKTKKVWSVTGSPGWVIIENKDDITKNDDPTQTRKMLGKAGMATTTTCAVFQLLKDAGIPVAFEKRLGPNEFLAPRVDMILLEIIWRRYAPEGSSFLKRRPDLARSEDALPHRFHSAVFELFLKTTGGVIKNRREETLGTISPDDPFIANPGDDVWNLFHPKEPGWNKAADLQKEVSASSILPHGIGVNEIKDLLHRVGLVLEGAWAQLGCRLIDFKIEMGVTDDGKLVVADVIDADSWRLRTADWKELSKQLFRDNADMSQVVDKYSLVAQLVIQLRIPKQVIVIWRGSQDDACPVVPSVAGIQVVDVVLSGHKSPQSCLNRLEGILTEYPEGGVILACIGMSNGLGPLLSARTSWPVIGVVMTADQSPNDVWSNLRMPSNVPMCTMLSPKNAVLLALNILSQKNPAAYAERQQRIEELDD